MTVLLTKEGFSVTTRTEFEMDMDKEEGQSVLVTFEDGHGDSNFTIDFGVSTKMVVPDRKHLDKLHKMLDAAWEHWVEVEKEGKS